MAFMGIYAYDLRINLASAGLFLCISTNWLLIKRESVKSVVRPAPYYRARQ